MLKTQKLKQFCTKYHNQLYFVVLGLVLLAFWYMSWARLDPDFGWHFRSGQYILHHWVPAHDIYSFTAPQFAWINHEWLNDIIVAGLMQVGGYSLVALFFAGVWSLALLIASRKHGIIALLLAAMAFTGYMGVRPVAWAILMLAILERILHSKKPYANWWLPVLLLAWANLHGSFVLGLIIIVGYQVLAKRKLPWLVVGLSLLATVCTPYGWGVYVEVARTMFDTTLHQRIGEWRPVQLPYATLLYVVAIISLHFTLAKHCWRKLISLPGLLFAMSMSSVRHFPLFVVGSLRYLEDYIITAVSKARKLQLTLGRKVVVGIILGIFCGVWLCFFWNNVILAKQSALENPHKAVQYFSQHPCPGNIFNSYNYGGYLIWQLPNTKFYIDGRMPSWSQNGVNYMETYLKVMKESGVRQSEISKFNLQCAILSNAELSTIKQTDFVDTLRGEGWQKVDDASDAQTTVLIKTP